jgi:FMN phosphatase YigB (HAD superfamily)
MHAAIFDIDGTLLDSNGSDGELYIAAVESVLGRVRIRSNWREYGQVTDSGILTEILLDNGISADRHIVAAIKSTFIEKLRRHIDAYGPFSEIPGAREFLRGLCGATDRACAYATGCWSASALMKLESAEFPIQAVPISSADDSHERRAIMANALRQLGRCETVTYYGDDVWDREAALSLGWEFVPVGAALGGITRFETSAPTSNWRLSSARP